MRHFIIVLALLVGFVGFSHAQSVVMQHRSGGTVYNYDLTTGKDSLTFESRPVQQARGTFYIQNQAGRQRAFSIDPADEDNLILVPSGDGGSTQGDD